MKALRILLSIILWACMYQHVAAVNRSFERLNIDNGLSNPTVECSFRDYLGYMWFGTSNGLNKFDGYNISKYFNVKTDSTSISSNDVRCIYEDSYHNLWIGTFNSVELYNRTQDNFIHKNLPGTVITVRTFFQDSQGTLWVGTFGHGLYRYDYEKQKFEYPNIPELISTSIAAIYEDKKSNLWIGTELNGVFVLDRNRTKIFNFKDAIPGIGKGMDFSNYKIRSFVEDSKGNIWFASYGSGIFIYNFNERRFLNANEIILADRPKLIAGIIKDADGIIWIGSDGDGLFTYNPRTGLSEQYNHLEANNYSLCSDAIRSLYIDNENLIWIGSFSGGLCFTDINAASNIKLIRQSMNESHSAVSNNITGIAEDYSGKLWITTDGGGVFTYDYKNDSWKHIEVADYKGKKYKNALCIFPESPQSFWIGNYLSGITRCAVNGSINYYYPILPTIGGNDIRAIVKDPRTGLFWCATDGDGIFSFSPEKGVQHHFISHYTNAENDLAYNFVRCLLFDSKGMLWIGTSSSLTRFEPATEKMISLNSSNKGKQLSSTSINCILESSEGYLYFGTEKGLCMLETPVWSDKFAQKNLHASSDCFNFSSFDVTNGLPDNIVNSLIEDRNGSIWIGTSGGLAQFNPGTRKIKEVTVKNNGKPVFNKNAAFKIQDGTLFLGTTDGLVSFNPDSIKESTLQARVVITDIKINSKSLASSDNQDSLSIHQLQSIELRSFQKSITFEFSTMEMMHPDNIRFSYKLEGFDENWTIVDASHRYATYTNLNEGNYTFKIKATNYEGIWSEMLSEIKISVYPPFYKSWWFKLAVLLILAMLFYLYFVVRVRNIEGRNRKLEVLVKKRSDELLQQQESIRQQELEKTALLMKQKELEASNLQAEKELIVLRNQKLQDQLEDQKTEIFKRNNELAASSLQLNQKMEFLTHLKSFLKDLEEKAADADKKYIQNLISQIEKDNSIKKEWEQFEFHFDKANNNYFQKLKSLYPDLTIKDLQMCSFLRLNLSNKEIASILNISTRGVEKSRSRLRKKMNLESDLNLAEYLIQL